MGLLGTLYERRDCSTVIIVLGLVNLNVFLK